MGCFKRTALKRILSRVKQITSPGWMHESLLMKRGDLCSKQRELLSKAIFWKTSARNWQSSREQQAEDSIH